MKKTIFFLLILLASLTLNGQSKYAGRVDLGFGSDYNLTLYTAHGKLVTPNLFVGLGTGFNTPILPYEKEGVRQGDVVIVPLVLDVQFIPLKSVVSPIISTQFGAENTFITKWSEPYGNPVTRNYKLVGVVSPSVGLRVRLVDKLALNFKFYAHFRTASTQAISKQAYSYSLGIEF